MSINLLNVQLPNEETNSQICLICHDTLEGCHNYTLPECKHTYHTECILTWFRLENQSNCPYCGNKGVNNRTPNNLERRRRRGFYSCNRGLPLFADIIAYSRRKDAPKLLVKKVEKLRELEETQKQHLQSYKSKETVTMTRGDAIKYYNNYRTKKWSLSRKVMEAKREISAFPIVPIIIPKVVNMS